MMALIVKDRVLETCSTSGLVDFTLTGAVTGYQRFSAIGNGNTTYYAAYVIGSNDWEVGIGTVGTSSLTRDTILSSSTGSKVNFAGNPVVWCDLPSSKALFTDSNNNATANSFLGGFTSVTASGTQIVLTAASTPNYVVTGSGGQTIKLPDATTLANGYVFSFDNNQSSGAITVNNNSNTLMVSVPSGGYVYLRLLSNATAAGSWDRHDLAPSNVSWSTNTFDYPGSITSATWNGSTVAYNRGGTGQSSNFVAGGIVYGSSTTALAVTSVGTTGQALLSNGASAPTWGTITQGVVWQSIQTANFTAVAGNAYPVNTTSSAITVTLPASPTANQLVTILDYAGTTAINNILIAPNGNKIQGVAATFVLNINRQSVNLVYIDSTQGWVSYADQNVSLNNTYSANYLVVAGGGGGGLPYGGGGGAGGLITGSTMLSAGTVYSFVIGAGGAGLVASGSTLPSYSGSNSTAFGLTAIGGGGGGGWNSDTPTVGKNGGSGGGGGPKNTSTAGAAGGSGTSGQGNDGGSGKQYFTGGGGGGGGSSSVGLSGGTTVSGNGGNGTASSITGSSVVYAGGGAGGIGFVTGSYSSGTTSGGGGAGGYSNGGTLVQDGQNGTANTGGGGGGGGGVGNSYTGTGNSGAGGSGVVIISIPSTNYTGIITGSPTVTTSGGNTIIKFTSSGSYTA
jgi:hypothetical protein